VSGSLLALGELVALAYVSFALVISLSVAVVYPLVRDRLGSLAPEDRSNWLLGLSLAPTVGAFLMTVACLLPSVEGLGWHLVDHCFAHGNDHPHLCMAHLPMVAGTVAGIAALVVLAALSLSAIGDLARTIRLSRRLRSVIESTGSGREIDSAQPLAATIGILRPKVMLSKALRRSLPDDLIAAIERHEEAHVRRRDPLVRTVARLAAVFHLPGTRRRVLGDLQLACEQACDEYAAREVGDRLTVASALLAMERLLASNRVPLPSAVAGFGGASIAARVNALTENPISRARVWLPATLAGVLTLLVVTADTIHHTTETLLGLFTR
jgi:Zn-dependent protease with chaperone function